MPLGSVIALLCAFFVIFFLPYMEKKDKKKKWKSYYKVININVQNSLIKSSHKSLNLWLLFYTSILVRFWRVRPTKE